MAKRRVVNYDRLPDVKRGSYYLLDSLLGLGVGFTIDGDKLTATGQGASPVVQALIDKHAPQMIAMLVDAGLQGGVMARGNRSIDLFPAGQGSSQHYKADSSVAMGQGLTHHLSTESGGELTHHPSPESGGELKPPDRMQLIRNGIEGARKQQQKQRAMAQARRKVRA